MTTPEDAPEPVTVDPDDVSTTEDEVSATDDAPTDEDAADDVSSDEADRRDAIATGILAAEHRAQEQIARRRRFLIGGAVLGLVIAGAVLAVMTVLQQQANTEAQLASQRAEARADFARAVVDRAEDYEPPARAVGDHAGELRATLEQFLTETEVTDDELGRRVDILLLRLEQDVGSLGELTTRDVPEPPELVDAERAVTVLRELETLRAEAGALGEEIPIALDDVEQWLGAVRDVNRAVADHVAQVESEQATSNPGELLELWRDERPTLQRLSTAAGTAAEVDGLESWAGAHQQYADDLMTWIDEAVSLLEDDDLDTYNERFDELFDTDDPFDFNAAVAAATDDALASPALLQLGTLQQRATLVDEAVDLTEITTAEELGQDGPDGIQPR